MKKVFIFLFIVSSACKGQIIFSSPTTITEGRLVLDTAGNLIGYETGDLFHAKYHKLPSIEEKLLLYAQECYNDSSLGEKQYHKTNIDTTTCERTVALGNPPYYYPCEKQSHYYRKWIHHKPTFEGFIEWLKKQK